MPLGSPAHFGAVLAIALVASSPAQDPVAAAIRYDRDVRPILAERCFRCHGPDEGTRSAELRLDDEAAARAPRDDGAAIVPGDADASLVWQRVTSDDPDERMPPPDSGKQPLTASELAIVRRWIGDGAAYEPHWSFVPPVRPKLPANAAPGAHPIDAFVDARLRERRLETAPLADRETLARRTFLVLTGLPPTPAEIDAFVADREPRAFERLVDRLLDEEPYRSRFAEHFAGPWLDAARYADTSGIHMDAGRQIWPWRDWLFAALRDDLPFDRFVTDQIAGDLMPNASVDQHVASGFLRLHVTTDEGGAIDEEYRVEYAAERTATVGSVLLGLTVGCARCHDHKYDPIRQEDFYRLFAFFNSNREPGLYSQDQDSNRALEPFLQVPRPAQQLERERLQRELATLRATLDAPAPQETAAATAFLAALDAELAARWTTPVVKRATSQNGAVLTLLDDASVLASGENPPTDVHTLELETDAEELQWLCLTALPDPSLPHGKVGRAANGNAVLQHLLLEARPRGSAEPFVAVPLLWATADVVQRDGDHVASNVVDDDGRGYAVAAHQNPPGPRHLLVLAGKPFGHRGGTELRVVLKYDSEHYHHTLGRVRIAVGSSTNAALSRLPVDASGFYTVGPVPGPADALYGTRHGPEAAPGIDARTTAGEPRWRFAAPPDTPSFGGLPTGANATFVAQVVHAAAETGVAVSLGSDDGFQFFVNGELAAERRVERSLQPDQDRVTIRLRPGGNVLVLKVINTGGDGGFASRLVHDDGVLHGDLQLALLPANERSPALLARFQAAHRERHSPGFLAQRAAIAGLERDLGALEAAIPRTMVMSEAESPRATFVLQRGEYDKPDLARPVTRELPAMFGRLPDDAPRNRLGLARWLVSDQNPLFARVAMNRLWQFVFGNGIVRTTEDFGTTGEWPSHPELLDWLACEFRARGFSTKAMLRLVLTSAAFRRSSVRPTAAAAADPDNRLLAWFPRRRLVAEAIRDQALFAAGLLVERSGGPSVKPRQPDGLWREVAMVQSNTRDYVPSTGDDRWRRSVYVYWKRACPPPNLLTFDAPTREFCTIRRTATNTPLQALVLWNDPQFVEAARALAERTLREAGDDATRLALMHRRCTGHPLDAEGLELAQTALRTLRARFAAAPADADLLRAAGDAPVDATLRATDVAPFVVLANAFLALDASLCID